MMGFAAFRNLRILAKTLLGFGCVLVILAIVAGSGILSLMRTSTDLAHYTSAVALSDDSAAIERDLWKLRNHVDTYVRTGDKAEIDIVHDLEQELAREIAHGIEIAETDSERGQLGAMQTQLQVVVDDFEQAVLLETEREALVTESLAVLGPKLVADFEAIQQIALRNGDNATAVQAGDAARAALAARFYVNLLLDRRENAAADQAKAAFAALATHVADLERSIGSAGFRAELDDAKALLPAYQDAFENGRDIDARLVDLIQVKLAGASETILAAAEAVKHEVEAEEERLAAEIETIVVTGEWMAVGFGIAGLVLGLAIAWLIGRGISQPIVSLSGIMQRLSEGQRDVEVEGAERKDEVGQMASALHVFKENMIAAEKLRAEQQVEQDRQLERARRMAEEVARFDKVIAEVVNAVSAAATELQSTAQSLSATAEETAQQSNTVAAAAEQMTQNVQTVASATEELSASISEISSQVSESTRIVGQAVTQAGDTNARVKNLAEVAHKIGEVVTLINDIAGQTNLLALNATIEAARAGEAGKGFAVVASEVKALATQTARATDEIATQVRAIQDSTESSAESIDSITKTINRVSEIATTIASAVEEQGAATQEISRNVQEAATGTSEVTSNVIGVTQASQQTSAASTQVLSAANDLSRYGETLRSEVESFLHTVRNL